MIMIDLSPKDVTKCVNRFILLCNYSMNGNQDISPPDDE